MSENQKKIWITGASSGIGKALAEKFAAEGWMVAVSARRKEILDEMANNENIFSFPLDVTNQDQVNNISSKIIDDFGNLLAGGLTETRLVEALCFCLRIPVSTSSGFFAMFVKCKLVDRSC